MTTEELKEKYGDEMVWVVPSSEVKCDPEDGPFFDDSDIDFCAKKGFAKYRWEVENDPSFKQLVVYAVVKRRSLIFTTHRLAGDGRLTGKYSIGTGGHIQPGESFTEALFRELEEEVGLDPNNMVTIMRVGYIMDNSSEVNSVHLGIVYIVEVEDGEKVTVREPEKLSGEWLFSGDIANLQRERKLESWSDIAFRHCI